MKSQGKLNKLVALHVRCHYPIRIDVEDLELDAPHDGSSQATTRRALVFTCQRVRRWHDTPIPTHAFSHPTGSSEYQLAYPFGGKDCDSG